jgi:hypothetical protein
MAEEKKNIGDVINKLSKKPISFDFEIGAGEDKQVFKLYIHKPDFAIMSEYSKMTKDLKENDPEAISASREAIKFVICACVKDEAGSPIWEKSEDIDLTSTDFLRLQNAVVKYALKFDIGLSDFERKNLLGSPSSETVSP